MKTVVKIPHRIRELVGEYNVKFACEGEKFGMLLQFEIRDVAGEGREQIKVADCNGVRLTADVQVVYGHYGQEINILALWARRSEARACADSPSFKRCWPLGQQSEWTHDGVTAEGCPFGHYEESGLS